MIFKAILTFLICLIGLQSFAQDVRLYGKVTDTLKSSIPYVNLIAQPEDKTQNNSFAITDEEGKFSLKLKKNKRYFLTISHLAYSKVYDTISLDKNKQAIYTLNSGNEQLDEVIIKSEMAVIVKKDTIIYKSDQFVTKGDRKLEDLLKKLPGIEITSDGNVLVNGKKVDKLMIDGKDFFGGDTKLGIKNIPVSVIDEVEALDNYTDIPFMKNLSDSDKMVLNIKLKEGKKNFVFGESELSGGIKNRYIIHPSYFYYSPKTSVNTIANFNNINKSSLDYNDINRFRDRDNQIIYEPILSVDDGLNNLNSNEIARFRKSNFIAGNINHEVNDRLTIDAYSIYYNDTKEKANESRINYLTQSSDVEARNNSESEKSRASLNKISIKYKPNDKTYYNFKTFYNITQNDIVELTESILNENETNRISESNSLSNINFSQLFSYNKQHSYNNTTEIQASYKIKDKGSNNRLGTNLPSFPNFIPYQDPDDDQPYELGHDYNISSHVSKLHLKHFWLIDFKNHIYPIAGVYSNKQKYDSQDYQLINDEKNDFSAAGFNNNSKFDLLDLYAGIEYKVKFNKLVLKSSLVFHQYFWKFVQYSETLANTNKGMLLPEFTLDYDFSLSKKLSFTYSLNATFENITQYANRYRLISFNQLYRGNNALENNVFHNFNTRYSNFNLSSNINYYINLNYNKVVRAVRQETIIEGNDQVITPNNFSFPENNINLSGRFSKKWKNIKFAFNGHTRLQYFSRIVNTEKLNYDSQNYNYTFRLSTSYKTKPNIGIGVARDFNYFNSTTSQTKIQTIAPNINLQYRFLKHFEFRADYRYNYYKSSNSKESNIFQIANTKLLYKNEKSNLGLELSIENILNIKYINRNYFNEFIINDETIFIQPRTVILSLVYQI